MAEHNHCQRRAVPVYHYLLIDTILGLYQRGKLDLKLEFLQTTERYCTREGIAPTYDANTLAHALAQQITIDGVVGSQMLRTLVVLTSKTQSRAGY